MPTVHCNGNIVSIIRAPWKITTTCARSAALLSLESIRVQYCANPGHTAVYPSPGDRRALGYFSGRGQVIVFGASVPNIRRRPGMRHAGKPTYHGHGNIVASIRVEREQAGVQWGGILGHALLYEIARTSASVASVLLRISTMYPDK